LWDYARRVGAGPKAEAFQISDTKLVRLKSNRYLGINFTRTDDIAVGELIEEQRIANALYQANVPVLKPDGVFRMPLQTIWKPRTILPIALFEQKYFPGLVMPYVHGTLLEHIPRGERQTALHERVAKEIVRVTRIEGFSIEPDPNYNFAANVIVDARDNFYFIGLSPWRRKRQSV
jgi:hypothetical protein